jgi:hypothetical protein
MIPKKKSLETLQQEVHAFNLKYPVGSKLKLTLDFGEVTDVVVRNEASILGGHSAVTWLEGIAGCYSLDKVVE